MKEITQSAKTIEEAIDLALQALQVKRDQVETQVLEEPKKGILGLIGNKAAIVKVIVKNDPIDKVTQYIENIAQELGVSIQFGVIKHSERDIEVQMNGDNLALLIGKRGQTLNALQYLCNLVANRYTEHKIRIVLDAEGYRERRKESLEKLAVKLAEKAVYTRRSVKLEPMPSYERKIIHACLQQNEEINTVSYGEEPHRYIVISPFK